MYGKNLSQLEKQITINVKKHEAIIALKWEIFKSFIDPKKLRKNHKLYKKLKMVNQIKNAVKDLTGIKNNVEVKKYGKETYIIIRGKMAGIRKYIKGVRYKGFSPQQVTLGITKKNLTKGLSKKAVFISVIINVGDKIIEHLQKSEWFWSKFLSDLGIDIARDLTASAAGVGAGLLTATALAKIATAGIAVPLVAGASPIAVAVGTGIFAGKGLDFLIEKYEFKKVLTDLIEKAIQPIKKLNKQLENNFMDFERDMNHRIKQLYFPY